MEDGDGNSVWCWEWRSQQTMREVRVTRLGADVGQSRKSSTAKDTRLTKERDKQKLWSSTVVVKSVQHLCKGFDHLDEVQLAWLWCESNISSTYRHRKRRRERQERWQQVSRHRMTCSQCRVSEQAAEADATLTALINLNIQMNQF